MDRNGWKTRTNVDHSPGEPWIDSLSKAMAQGTSRRAALKLLVGGVVATTVGISLPGLRTKAVAASASALAPAPAAEAIAPAVLLASSAICPDRVPNGTPPSFNGCGSTYSSWVVPNSYAKAKFTGACNNHDICYSTCNKSKDDCDYAFYNELKNTCKAVYTPGTDAYGDCIDRSGVYFSVVQDHGQGAYDKAQKDVCKCCDGPKCGSTCCAKGQTCCNGTCCPEGQYCCKGTCSPTPCGTVNIYCPCNGTTYPDEGACTANCHASLACFVNICGPAPLGPVK